MKKSIKTSGYLAAIVYSIISGLAFIFGKKGLEHSNPMDLLAFRFTSAFIAMMIPVLFKWVKLDINKKMLKRIVPMAIFSPLLFFGFQSFALDLLPSTEVGIFLAISPVLTMILASYVLKERTTILQKISILVLVLGVIYIGVSKSSSLEFRSVKGIVFLLIAVVSLAIYNVMARKLTEDYSIVQLTATMITISFIAFNVLAIGQHIIAKDIGGFIAPLRQRSFVISVVYLGVISTFVSSYLSNYALSKIESYKMSVFSNLTTIISIIAGVVLLNEKIYYYHIIGSILIISGVLGANLLGQKDKEDKQEETIRVIDNLNNS